MKKEKEAKPTASTYGERQVWTVTIVAPIETVWSALVRTEEVLPFLFGTVCETESGLQPGKRMRMVSKNRRLAISVGEVLEFNPPFRFSHTTSFTQVEGEQPARTTYELKEIPGGTQLTLISEAVPGTKTGRMVLGGSMIVANLKRYVETGRGTPFPDDLKF